MRLSLLVLSFVLVGFVLHRAIKVWRRAYSSPLKELPGPSLSRFSSIPFLWRGVFGSAYQWCVKCHAKYGSIYRSGPCEVSITHVEAVRQVLLQDDLPKAPFYAAIRVERPAPTLLTSVNRDDRKRISEATLHTLAGRGLAELEVLLGGMVSDFFIVIDGTFMGEDRRKINVYGQFTNLAMDIIGQVVWGRPFGFLGKDSSIKTLAKMKLEDQISYESLNGTNQSEGAVQSPHWNKVPLAVYDHTPFLGLATFIPGLDLRPRSSKDAISVVRQASVERYEESEKPTANLKGILADIFARNKSIFSIDEATNHGAELIVGGTDSITGVVTAAINYLLLNPDKLRKLQQSVKRLDSGIPDGESLRSNEYLTCCIKEAIRLHTPVNFSIRRVPKDVNDYEIMGHRIPSRTFVRIPLRSIHHDPETWPQPTKFWPERWFQDEERREGAPAANERAFFGFSIGSRVCIGKSYAWLLMRMMLGGLIARYDIELIPNQKLEWRSVFVSSLEGGEYNIVISKRLERST